MECPTFQRSVAFLFLVSVKGGSRGSGSTWVSRDRWHCVTELSTGDRGLRGGRGGTWVSDPPSAFFSSFGQRACRARARAGRGGLEIGGWGRLAGTAESAAFRRGATSCKTTPDKASSLGSSKLEQAEQSSATQSECSRVPQSGRTFNTNPKSSAR